MLFFISYLVLSMIFNMCYYFFNLGKEMRNIKIDWFIRFVVIKCFFDWIVYMYKKCIFRYFGRLEILGEDRYYY